MLAGSVAGGMIAQATDLGVPYILRAVILAVTLVLAFVLMRDLGFTPRRAQSLTDEVKHVLKGSLDYGLGNPPVRWVMLASPFTDGVAIYAFYAMQPYLLQLYGDEQAYGIAGLAAAIFAGAQIAGGLLVPSVRRRFRRRTSVLLTGTLLSTAALAAIGLMPNFWLVVTLLVLWGLMFAAVIPVRQAYIHGLIPSGQRATVLSFDSLLGSSGGVLSQPVLGRAADMGGYPVSYLYGAVLQSLAIPFVWLARREKATSDQITGGPGEKPMPSSRRTDEIGSG